MGFSSSLDGFCSSVFRRLFGVSKVDDVGLEKPGVAVKDDGLVKDDRVVKDDGLVKEEVPEQVAKSVQEKTPLQKDGPVKEEVPVLIIGAGPTGLLTAAMLSRSGSEFRPGFPSRSLDLSAD